MGSKGGKNIAEGGNHGIIVLGGHSANKDGSEVINVCNNVALHGFEGADGERTWEASVHCSCVEVGKGSNTRHVMGGADFFNWLETVDIATGLDDDWLHGAHGLNALLIALHVAFVGCSEIRQVGVDKMCREAGDGCKLPASF